MRRRDAPPQKVPRARGAGDPRPEAAGLDVSFRIDLSEPAPRAAGWVPTHRLTRVGCAPAPPTWALTQPALRPLAEQQPALTLAG